MIVLPGMELCEAAAYSNQFSHEMRDLDSYVIIRKLLDYIFQHKLVTKIGVLEVSLSTPGCSFVRFPSQHSCALLALLCVYIFQLPGDVPRETKVWHSIRCGGTRRRTQMAARNVSKTGEPHCSPNGMLSLDYTSLWTRSLEDVIGPRCNADHMTYTRKHRRRFGCFIGNRAARLWDWNSF
jgi:hypothetical protein